ncbi:MAG: hypothetical protein EAZ74_03990 [Alphaproteobacteria bacterium]|nr:MAG: hypothetical protein EAY76_03985 [Alphaproteobacteria bacterium]TAF14398.1 MAG: hypothetical protein EAZ74_03990 [Alphaproteobacteria bacterium]TAF40110.1 MAG: hypothetical protein EAZ66_03715 [Alphaproteobacteria bacterium]TAF77542.1 MAG: hypothetical protein EAZ52_00120 [Alphaproteobacteria bacterium]
MFMMSEGWKFLTFGIILAGISMPLAKAAHGFDKLHFAIPATLLAWAANMCWIMSMKQIPLSTAYLVWLGFDALIMIFVSVIMFNETITLQKSLFMLLIFIGCIGLTLGDSPHE